MRPSGHPSESLPRRTLRSTLTSSSSTPTKVGRWFLILAVLAFAIPVGALPVSGSATLPTHAVTPMALVVPVHAVHVLRASHVASNFRDPLLGSKGPGPALTPAQINGLSVFPASPQSIQAAMPFINPSKISAPASPPAAYSGPLRSVLPQSLGPHGIESRLKNESKAIDSAKANIYQVPIGWFTGFINDTVDGAGISNAAIQVYSSALCSTNRCPAAQTTANGSFKIACPAPGGPGDNDAIVLTTNNWYFDNVSYATCNANVTTWVGTIFLVRDGVGIGLVKDPTTGKPIAGVTVQAITRDGTFLGYPNAVTASNGSFLIGLPPVASRVTFSPPPGYEGTFNYTDVQPGTGNRPNVPPWLGGDNMGTFYLVRQTLVRAHLIDAQTNASFSNNAAITACDAFGSGCMTQGPGVISSNVQTFANPGWNYFNVFA
ncbi:MAG: carboxypeptidase-like regulatory domain-containing protein, partial [Thermoplasmata archaeon]|nr:carboxypeptidase-like regulatory domain-containing protein [Thermoplasmata archaeon]